MLDVLYANGPCLVVAKPAGLLTQAPSGIDSLETRIKDELGADYLGVVHRLDRPATGAMVFALTRKAAGKLSQQFAQRWVRKIYWVAVEGTVAPDAGTWTDRILKVPGEPRAEISPAGRDAVLHYVRRGGEAWGSWLEVELQTGRTHQIRVQAASRGHPVLGDAQYGATGDFGPRPDDHRLRAIALHSRSLSFRDPTSREDVTVTAPLPTPWQALGLPAET